MNKIDYPKGHDPQESVKDINVNHLKQQDEYNETFKSSLEVFRDTSKRLATEKDKYSEDYNNFLSLSQLNKEFTLEIDSVQSKVLLQDIFNKSLKNSTLKVSNKRNGTDKNYQN